MNNQTIEFTFQSSNQIKILNCIDVKQEHKQNSYKIAKL